MADLTLQQRFGSSVSFDETTKILSIDLNDLTDTGDITTGKGLTVTGIDANTIDANATKILWTLLLLSQQNQPTDNIDETVSLYITNEGKRNVTRNNVSQFGYRLVATAYKNDTLGTTLDPDEIS